MDQQSWLTERFEENRPRLRGVAYRMLGSLSEADDAVQEAWLRFSRTDTIAVDNLGGWLTTVVSRVCLDILRSRKSRREEPFDAQVTRPGVARGEGADPESEAMLADSVGVALLVVLNTLTPAERLAFVLHDMFSMPFDEIGAVVGRTPAAVRQLASRARRRVADAGTAAPNGVLARQRAVVDAFFAAARVGDFDALLRILDPDVVLRADFGGNRPMTVVRGVDRVVKLAHAPRGAQLHPVSVNGLPGMIVTIDAKPTTIMAFTVVDGRIVEIAGIADPDRVAGLVPTLPPTLIA
jgi:RNA polymerase sigma-70 factor (ECF subfamily)